MKKRLLSALLALALVFVLLPTTALAGETTGKDYDISINGKGYKFDSDGSNGYITAYYYGNSPSNYFFSTEADHQWATNSNLKLTKEDNTVTITIRPKKKHISGNAIEFTLEKKSTTSGNPYDYTPCIEMGNNNNLVITGKGTLNITRDEKNGIGAALCSEVGDITITDGITVKANFLKQVSNSTVGNAISVKDHNLIISGKNTKVEARNSSCNFQDLYDVSATVCVENGEIKVSDGATLSAINNFTNSYTSQYSYYSRAISGSSSKPCALTVTGENSCVIAETDNSLGKAYGYVNFSIDGAKIEVGTSSPAQTITDINDISNYKYAKISVPALTKTSDVLIAGKDAVVGVETSIPSANGSGTYFYDQASKTLTLKDVNIASSSIINGIQFTKDGTYTINLVGTNTMSGFSTGISANSADQYVSNINITITGAGSLEVSTTSYAIAMNKGDLKFENTGAIKLATGKIGLNNNALSVKGNITITDMSKYSVTGTQQTGGKPLGSEVSLTEASQLKGGTTGYRIITITPAAAKPSTIRYNGTTLKQGETITGENGGTATVAAKGNTITLKNFNGTALSFEATLADSTLVLEGTNTLSSIVTTQKGLTISGSGSLTVGSIRVPNNTTTSNSPSLTIDGAKVTAGTPTSTTRAVEVKGDLTVTNGSLTATSKSDSVPTVQVGGNASFTGSTSTITITNYSTTQGKSGKNSYEVSTGLYVGGTLDIKNAAKVTSTVTGGNAIYAKGDITISGNNTEVKAQNSAYKFSAISTNGTVNISDNSTVKAENGKKHQGDPTGETDPSTGKTYNPCPAINGKIANKNSQNKLHIAGFTTSNPGTSNPTDGVVLNRDIDPSSAVPYILHYAVTITRGAAYETPQVAANYKIAGQTMYVGKYYKTDANGNITDGTAQDYNIYCDSENDFTLNNATISSTGTSGGSTGVIMTNLDYSGTQIHIKLIGTNSINNIGHHAILGEGENSRIIIENAENASNASLTISGNFLPVYSYGYVTINAEVVIKNTDGKLISTKKDDHANGAFDLGSGYKCYASTSTTGTPLEEFNSANYSTYKYLRVTTRTLETGGGSTHQHTYDQSAWKSDATHHWQECTDPNCPDPTKGITNKASHSFSNGACTVCGYRGQTEEHHFSTDWTYDETHHWHACTDKGCDAISGKAPHEWTGWRIDEPSPGMHNRFCNCGYNDYSHHYNLVYAAAGEAGHYQYCTLGNCTFKTSTVSHNYDGDTCTICNYTKSGEIEPPTPDNPGTIVIIRPAEEEKPAQQPNPSTGANDLVGLAVAAAVAAALGSAALLRKHD